MNPDAPLISVVLPAFNEAGILDQNLAELLRYTQTLQPAYRFEFILVNDGSSDDTPRLAAALAASHPDIALVNHASNRGLGAALRTGFEHAHGDVIVTLDLDLSYAPPVIGALLEALAQQHADIAVASPYLKGGRVRNVPWLRKAMSAWANRFLSVAAGGAVATLTGMVRAYDANAVRALGVRVDGMEINHELLFAALKKGLRVVEIPANLEWRQAAPAETLQAATPVRRSSMKMASHIWSVLSSGFRHRPTMFLALPALIPGLLPFVLAVVLLLRPSHAVMINTTLVTLAIQWASLGFLTLMTGSYLYQMRSITRRASLTENGTHA
jgi:hypothetical protein